MNGDRGSLASLIENTFKDFLLRDFLGRIVPGAAVLLALWWCQFSHWHHQDGDKTAWPLWLLGFGVAWLIGQALRAPWDAFICYRGGKRQVVVSDDEFIRLLVKVHSRSNTSESVLRQLDRYAVVKEACQGASASAAVVVLTMFLPLQRPSWLPMVGVAAVCVALSFEAWVTMKRQVAYLREAHKASDG